MRARVQRLRLTFLGISVFVVTFSLGIAYQAVHEPKPCPTFRPGPVPTVPTVEPAPGTRGLMVMGGAFSVLAGVPDDRR